MATASYPRLVAVDGVTITCFTYMRYFRMVVYERVWLGLPVKGGEVTGGPVKQVMSVKEGKGMFSFWLVCFQVA